MAYTLTFTIYSLIFTILLQLTVRLKKRKDTVRTKLYELLIIFGVLFAFFEVVGILVYEFISLNQLFFSVMWKFRMISIFLYIMTFIFYYDVLMNGEKFDSIFDTVFKTRKNLIVFIIFSLIIILYCIFGNFTISSTDEFVYMDGIVGLLMIFIGIGVSIYLVLAAYKIRSERRNIFNCFGLIFLIVSIVLPAQIAFSSISLMPLLVLYILYIVYHNIEDPDIALLNEVSILKNNTDNLSESKTDFLFSLSYDLINPISTINSLVISIDSMDTFDKDKVRDNYKKIISTSNIVLDSVNNLVDISLVNGKNEIKEYSIYDLVVKMKTLVNSKIGSKSIKFDLIVDKNVNNKYFGEIDKIQKVLITVLTNSCKYTSVGRIKLNINAQDDGDDNHILTFKIYDTGSGIKDEDKSSVFDGVELSLCKKIIESMGGSISFESVLAGGSTFYISLSQKKSGDKKAIDEISYDNNNETIEYKDLSKYKVLLVDDTEINNKVTSKLLEKYKLQITSITNSLECIDRIKKEEEYDLIFIDHKMKEVDGIEVVNLLRSLDGYKLPKIVCLTANVFSGARDYYINNGFDEYLSKPIDIHNLNRIVNKFLK